MNNTSRAWSWRHAVVASDISGDCKHLLITLSLYMNEMGGSCFPTIETLMANTGRGKTWVHKYLNEAVKTGWIERASVARKTSKGDNRGWRRNEYVAIWPEQNLTTESQEFQSSSTEKGSSPDEPPVKEGSSREVNGSSPLAKKVVREANTNIPKNIPNNIPSSSAVDVLEKPETAEKEDDGLNEFEEKGNNYWDGQFSELLKRHPKGTDYYSVSWKSAFLALNDEDKTKAVERHGAWLEHLKKIGRRHPLSLKEYFELRLFEGIEKKSDVAPRIILKPYSPDWFAYRLWLLVQGPTKRFKPSPFQQRRIDEGREDVIQQDKLKAEFPEVTNLDTCAFNGASCTLPDKGHRVVGNTTKINCNSDEWDAWKAFHSKMGWPWVETPKDLQTIVLPIALSELDHTDVLKKVRPA